MHPYKGLPKEQIWSKAFNLSEYEDNSFVTEKKFTISTTDKVATAGSCFAQHVGRYLLASDVPIIFAEQPPSFLLRGSKEFQSYYTYSARYGNIYTIHQLSDLVAQAFNKRQLVKDFFVSQSDACDLLRPSVVRGVFSYRELEHLREQHISAVRKLFSDITVLIFTFGLTEAWINREEGYVYPVCPGTIGGEFNPKLHGFKNFSFAEIYSCAAETFSLLRELNPDLKVIVTVSPVALSATYCKKHVSVANCYSKSVLRVVAETLRENFSYIDYFPSYDILTSPASLGRYIKRDLREISESGVDFAMKIFLREYLKNNEVVPRDSDVHGVDTECDEIIYGRM